eukprot:12015866-Heterocapsa_arctica.AAC.1
MQFIERVIYCVVCTERGPTVGASLEICLFQPVTAEAVHYKRRRKIYGTTTPLCRRGSIGVPEPRRVKGETPQCDP